MIDHFAAANDQCWIVALRVGALAHFVLVGLNLGLPRWLHWGPEMDRMSPLIRDVFLIHSKFIMLVLAIWGLLTWKFADQTILEPTELSRWLCGALMIFWAVRSVMQWTHYSWSHWRGDKVRTLIHWVLFVAYGVGAGTYGVAAFRT